MLVEEKRAYTEVLIILDKLNLLNYIPKEIVENMQKQKDSTWNFKYNSEESLEKQNMLRTTATLLSTLYLMYICDNQEEKQELKALYEENEKNYSEDCKRKLELLYNDEAEGKM